jgi:sigma-B regulation protein RsbU (phosphoserine phosphatase)
MAHLNAAFRSRLDSGLSLGELVGEASRLLLQSTITSHYATLACGRAGSEGAVEIVNAGHCPPLVVRAGGVEPVASTGFPMGLMEERSYGSHRLRLDPGDSIVLYTDGLTEARNRAGAEYGAERVATLLGGMHDAPPRELARACRADLVTFLEGAHQADDLTLMVVRRER